jgi:hypothetical protein
VGQLTQAVGARMSTSPQARRCGDKNHVGGGVAAPVLPHHRTYSSYPAVLRLQLSGSLVKARSRFNAVDACHSSNAAGPVPPSPFAPGRTLSLQWAWEPE